MRLKYGYQLQGDWSVCVYFGGKIF